MNSQKKLNFNNVNLSPINSKPANRKFGVRKNSMNNQFESIDSSYGNYLMNSPTKNQLKPVNQKIFYESDNWSESDLEEDCSDSESQSITPQATKENSNSAYKNILNINLIIK